MGGWDVHRPPYPYLSGAERPFPIDLMYYHFSKKNGKTLFDSNWEYSCTFIYKPLLRVMKTMSVWLEGSTKSYVEIIDIWHDLQWFKKDCIFTFLAIDGACISNSFLGFEFHYKLHILKKLADFVSCFLTNEKVQTKGIFFLVLLQSHLI